MGRIVLVYTWVMNTKWSLLAAALMLTTLADSASANGWICAKGCWCGLPELGESEWRAAGGGRVAEPHRG